MLRSPDTAPAEMTVAAARGPLESPRLRMLLVAEGDRLVGAIGRERLEAEADGSITLGRLADAGTARVGPDETVEHVLEVMEAADAERLPVVDDEDRLLGLVCFNRGKRHFCLNAVP